MLCQSTQGKDSNVFYLVIQGINSWMSAQYVGHKSCSERNSSVMASEGWTDGLNYRSTIPGRVNESKRAKETSQQHLFSLPFHLGLCS